MPTYLTRSLPRQPDSGRSGGKTGVNISDIISRLQKAQETANIRNAQRYRQALDELTGGREAMRTLYEKAAGYADDIGKTAAADISAGSVRQEAQGRQDLISSGLGNTTILGSMMRGVEEDRRRSMERVEEAKRGALMDLATRQAGAETGAAGSIASLMQSVMNQAPNQAQMAGLVQQAQQGQTAANLPNRVVYGGNAIPGSEAAKMNAGKFGFSSTGGGGGGGAGGGAGGGGIAAALASLMGGGGGGGGGRPTGMVPPGGGGGGGWDPGGAAGARITDEERTGGRGTVPPLEPPQKKEPPKRKTGLAAMIAGYGKGGRDYGWEGIPGKKKQQSKKQTGTGQTDFLKMFTDDYFGR